MFARRLVIVLVLLLGLLGGCASAAPRTGRSFATGGTTIGTTTVGIASYYADKYNGRKTANGEVFDNGKMTAAHRTLPFGTTVRVTNLGNGKSVVVRVNDRGPFVKGRIIDLSRAAAARIGMVHAGLARVRVETIKSPGGQRVAHGG